jgi:predicted acetyltransferase
VTPPVVVLGDEDTDAAIRLDWAGFGEPARGPRLEADRATFEAGRTHGMRDGRELVGVARAWASELSLPGGAGLPAAAVTGVGVRATHRRRGVLRALMTAQLVDVRERGEPLAVLTASEGGIYGRFGYGPATWSRAVALDRHRAALRDPSPPAGRFRSLDADAAARVLPEVHERLRLGRAGEIRRSAGWWGLYLAHLATEEEGGPLWQHVVWEPEEGRPAGCATYRLRERWEAWQPRFELSVSSVAAADSAGRLALWRYLLGVDLVSTVEAQVPVDEPLALALVDPRRLRVTGEGDVLWSRVLDLPRVLEARGYAAEGRLVIEVDDPILPDLGGRFELSVEEGRGACRRIGADPDLTLGAADLGAAVLGGTSLRALAGAGRVAEASPGAAARADRMLAVDPPPYCGTDF